MTKRYDQPCITALRELAQAKRRTREERDERIRRAHGADPELSQKDLAARFGCWPSTVRDALRGAA